MGTGIGWEWGAWAYPSTSPEKVDFKASSILPDATVAGLFGPGYNLFSSGTAAAIVKYSGNNYLVSGPCDISVTIPSGTPPGNWTVSVPSPLTDGAGTSFNLNISGTVNDAGVFSGTLPYIMNSLTVAGTPFFTADMTGSSAAANLIGSGTPSGIIGNFNITFGSGAAVVQGGFGGN